MRSARIYFKKQVRIDHLTFRQQTMFAIGNVGVASVKNRVASALGPGDAPAKPLTKRYAILKTRLGLGNRRNLMLTGDMLRNFMVRSVTDNKARASNSTRKDRLKAWINQKIEPWVVFSPKNQRVVKDATQKVLADMAPRLILERTLNGEQ
jgi:hypothetical protein